MTNKIPPPRHYQAVKKKVGRPTLYNEELAGKICTLIADGASIRKIGALDHMPERTAIMDWENKHPEFAHQIARARHCKADGDVEKLDEINEDLRIGTLDAPAAAVMSNNIKWAAGKMRPKKYGDKQSVELTGDKDKPVVVETTNVDMADLTDEQLAALEFLAAGNAESDKQS